MSNQNTQADFIYWATQYIKRKCVGARIKQDTGQGGLVLSWSYKRKDRVASWSLEEINAAMSGGADATRKLIRDAVRASLPDMFPVAPEVAVD